MEHEISLSRKTNQVDNLSDCLQRMWANSDLQVRTAVPGTTHHTREDYFNHQHSFQGPLPYNSLCDYYMAGLVVK